MFKKLIRLTAALILLLSFSITALPQVSRANSIFNLTVGSVNGYNPAVDGSSWWDSSNLREWLNSNAAAGSVSYTGAAPSYASTEGFLHEFSSADQSAIAVTAHRVNYNPAYNSAFGAGSANTWCSGPNVSNASSLTFAISNLLSKGNSYSSHIVNDKAFLLNVWDVYQYIQKRGYALDRPLTSQATAVRGMPSDDKWWTDTAYAPLANWDVLMTMGDGSDAAEDNRPNQPEGIVPALNLKPTATVNGVAASSLALGQTINFGQYLGVPIQWQVINKDNGYALIVATKAVDELPYNQVASSVYINSNYVNYATADVDYSSEPFASTTGNSDTTLPVLTLTNSSVLSQRENGAYALTFSATDDSSGVDHTVLPDGSTTTASSFSYTVSSNGYYVFKTYDKAGNVRDLTIPVSNINPPSSVIVSQSNTGWTTNPVTVTITSDNQVGANYSGEQKSRDNVFYTFPNYTSYTGKQVNISGSVKFNSAKVSGNLSIGFIYYVMAQSNNEYNLGTAFVPMISIPLSTLKADGTYSFNQTVSIPASYAMNLQAWTNLPITNTGDADVTFNNLKYSLVDTSDFQIKSITLPNGTVINNPSYTDTLTQAGTYSYTVVDARGQTYKETVIVKIDNTAPSLSVSGNPSSEVHTPVTLSASASDSQSGVQAIQTPDGIWHTSSSASYTVSQNGTYAFQTKDNVGNVSTQNVTVNNIGSLLWIDQTPTTNLSTSSTGSGKNQSINFSTGAFGVQDNRGNGNGWHVTLQATQLTGNGHTLPTGSLQVGKPSIGGSDSTVSSSISSYTAIDAGSPVSVASASSGNGQGTYSIISPLRVSAPASAYAGTYQATITEDLVSAP
ncbi:WxL domain-containing protein [Sporolactobacillus sp. KGMB 08714]|uniref:WxL domain-containing protein n=1 Tax=Sporolactobacillus sp. KGMB 08714 TaxID=3064704 RepID=UPI002FBEFF79